MEARVLKTVLAVVWMAALSLPAAATVQIVERDGRFELQAANETPRAVIDALAQRFRFEVVYPDRAWGATRGDFERRGSLDTLLAYVLDGTNYVAKYWSPDSGVAPTVTRLEIMDRMSASSQVESSVLYDDGVAQFEVQSSYEGVEQAEAPRDESAPPSDIVQATAPSPTRESVPPKRAVSASSRPQQQTISDMLATRANVQAAPEQPGMDSASAAVAMGPDQQAQLREMTRRAHAGVKDLATALRRAEAQVQQSTTNPK